MNARSTKSRHWPLLAALTASLSLLSIDCLAGAWTQNSGAGQLIVSGSYYSSSHFYDNNGIKQSQPDYQKYDLDPYLEYGLKDWLTVGGDVELLQTDQKPNSNVGIGQSEIFARARLWQGHGFVVSAQPVIVLPSMYSYKNQPELGSVTPDAGLGILGGYGFQAFGLNHSIDAGATYLYRFGTPKDQLNLSATMNISITPQWVIMPQLFTTTRLSSPQTASFTNSSADDYNLITLQLSAVYKITTATSLQLGGFRDLTGKNVGIGNGVMGAIWENF